MAQTHFSSWLLSFMGATSSFITSWLLSLPFSVDNEFQGVRKKFKKCINFGFRRNLIRQPPPNPRPPTLPSRKFRQICGYISKTNSQLKGLWHLIYFLLKLIEASIKMSICVSRCQQVVSTIVPTNIGVERCSNAAGIISKQIKVPV